MLAVYGLGLCYASVCTDMAPDEATVALNAECPTGLDHGWHVADEAFKTGEPNPSPCERGGDSKHYLFTC
jgi:hypothetical protein